MLMKRSTPVSNCSVCGNGAGSVRRLQQKLFSCFFNCVPFSIIGSLLETWLRIICLPMWKFPFLFSEFFFFLLGLESNVERTRMNRILCLSSKFSHLPIVVLHTNYRLWMIKTDVGTLPSLAAAVRYRLDIYKSWLKLIYGVLFKQQIDDCAYVCSHKFNQSGQFV